MKIQYQLMRTVMAIVAIGSSNVSLAENDPPPVFTLSDHTEEPVLAAFDGGQPTGPKVDQKGIGQKAHSAYGLAACEPWRLLSELPGNITATGWLNVGATAASDRPANRFVRPVTFNDREEVQVNQLYGVVERALDDSGGFSMGGRVDLLFGSDARFTEVRGLELDRDGSNGWNSRSFYRLSTPQVYAEFGAGDLSVKKIFYLNHPMIRPDKDIIFL